MAKVMKARGAMKAKAVSKGRLSGKRVIRLAKSKDSIRKALADLVTGQKVSAAASNAAMNAIPMTKRAGFPFKRTKGVDPTKWVTVEGIKVHIDFCRRPWLPGDWTQGLKRTKGGNTYTVYCPPTEYRTLYHQWQVEEYLDRKLGPTDGFDGQLRVARLAREQAPWDSEASFFSVLSAKERRHVLPTSKFHCCIISARRATSCEGVRDIAVVQAAFLDAGTTPVWYVDAASLESYRALGLKAKVGGKLCEARNLALEDAKRMGKICVQCSDDLANWEYRIGKEAKDRTMEAQNRAHKLSRCFSLSPVMAAKFLIAKMRGVEEGPPPRLGGGYILGCCSRTWGGDEFSRRHFILGDFFVADNSPCRFDESLTLKEDYDFVCSHIQQHGSVMRCNRLTFSAKHYSNAGGAVDERDSAGSKERQNMAILFRKWPQAIFPHGTRKNEVMLRWPGPTSARAAKPARGTEVRRTIAKNKVSRTKTWQGFSPSSVIVRTGAVSSTPYIARRCAKLAGVTVEKAVSGTFRDGNGVTRQYRLSDLKYDIVRGFLSVRKV